MAMSLVFQSVKDRKGLRNSFCMMPAIQNNGMSMIGIDVFLQSVTKGLAVLLAVAFDM
jgi:ABC-type glucose/galactose transport system permease subunit